MQIFRKLLYKILIYSLKHKWLLEQAASIQLFMIISSKKILKSQT